MTPYPIPPLSAEARAICTARMAEMQDKTAFLQGIDPVLLDLSLREPAVGIPMGHTVENKYQLLQLAREMGFNDILLGTFDVSLPEVPQVDDVFAQQLKASGADLTGCFAFATIGTFKPDGEFQPDLSMTKLVAYGIPNTILDVDVSRAFVAPTPEARQSFIDRLVASIQWLHANLRGDRGGPPRIYINYQDMPDAFYEDWEWVATIAAVLAQQPVAAATFEDGRGTSFPFQIGAMTAVVRAQLRPDQHLLVHMHVGCGMENANLIEALFNGADGVWAGFAREAATIGHAPSSELLANLARIGNRAVERYRLERLYPIAQAMTRINTLAAEPDDFPVIGANAYRTMLTFFEQAGAAWMDLPPQRIGAPAGWRVAPVASDTPVIAGRLAECGVTEPVSQTVLDRMRALMRQDMIAGQRIAYDDPPNLIALYRRALGA
ncbi:hypothetical protein GCM10007860_09550 [Chitiniphilus shinanonensis]|uniref:Pyruvate carboxyltransferase n=1 Tax=Chitiniphilus shinanonensis TaxID=553088 RepID=A0ABQ6BP63_9NEIS|nr:hypothetical protein [Chitiniphilus shinanonensis]GLS03810.1 hypothetical protein GCM10007860_09550 [Chitiniphilus shinanonensis]